MCSEGEDSPRPLTSLQIRGQSWSRAGGMTFLRRLSPMTRAGWLRTREAYSSGSVIRQASLGRSNGAGRARSFWSC